MVEKEAKTKQKVIFLEIITKLEWNDRKSQNKPKYTN